MSGKKASEQQATKLAAVVVEHHRSFCAGMSDDIQWAIATPAEALSLFVSALQNRAKQTEPTAKTVTKRTLTPFITIKTGGTTRERLIADIKANKNENGVHDEVSVDAQSMMANKAFVISATSGTADLVILTVAELDNDKPHEFMTAEFCAKWSVENLDGQVIELCDPSDGPQLRGQWLDQPKDTAVWCAMERITGSDGGPSVWGVERDSGGRRWLDGFWVSPGRRWYLGYRIVFRLRKITQN